MATGHSSSFDAETLDNTLLSIPEVYTAYVHPTLIMVLRLVGAVLAYCLLSIAHVLMMALKTILYPVYVIGNVFIIKPIGFLFHVCHLLYPVAVYLSFAVICGLMIGGCAGFTAEALSSFFINATWGPSASRSENNSNGSNSKMHQNDTLHGSDDDYSSDDGMVLDEEALDEGDYDSDYDHYEEKDLSAAPNGSPQKYRFSAISSSLASIWKRTPERDADSDTEDGDDGSSGQHQDLQSSNNHGRRRSPKAPVYSTKDKQMMAKGKQAMRQFPMMTNTNDLDDNTPRYRIGKKTLAYDSE